MTGERIELFIDRLCSFFPTDNIGRNTLKSGWRHSETLLDATDEQARKVLEICKNLPKFPNLAQVEHMFKYEMRGGKKAKFGCKDCDFNGWVDAGYTFIEERPEWIYHQVKRCDCTKAEAEKQKKEAEEMVNVLF